MNIALLRREYAHARLELADVDAEPSLQFARWLEEAIAAQVIEPTAMSLASVGESGRPSSRIVLLKGHDARGLVFYSSYASRKGVELDAAPLAACTFYWGELERQVRIEGSVERVSAAESDAYFAGRPVGSRISAAISPQSAVVPNRAHLEHLFNAAKKKFGNDVPRPETWGGYRVVPDFFEFWQGRPSRLHDRIRYLRLNAGQWHIERLAP